MFGTVRVRRFGRGVRERRAWRHGRVESCRVRGVRRELSERVATLDSENSVREPAGFLDLVLRAAERTSAAARSSLEFSGTGWVGDRHAPATVAATNRRMTCTRLR